MVEAGGENPVIFPAEQSGEERRKVVTMNDGIKDNASVVSRNKQDMTGNPKQTAGGGIYKKGGIIEENLSPIIMGNNNEMTTRENDILAEDIGVEIVDPKRRRMEEPRDSGPFEKSNTNDSDTDTTEEERLIKLSSKNREMVGYAMQSRPSL